MSKVDMPGAKRRIGAGKHEFPRDSECVFVSTRKHKGAGVGHQRSVETSGDIAIDGHTGDSRQAENKFGSGHHGGIDPIDMSEIASTGVMIDIDEKAIFKTIQRGAPYAVAFQQDNRIVSGHGIRLNDPTRKRRVLINAGHSIMHDDLRVFAHDAQNLAAGESRSDAISV